MIKNVHWSSYIVPIFLPDFNETLILDSFTKNTQISNVMHICPVGAEFFHMDGQTDSHDEANIHFLQFL
jgi:hypothetical protein